QISHTPTPWTLRWSTKPSGKTAWAVLPCTRPSTTPSQPSQPPAVARTQQDGITAIASSHFNIKTHIDRTEGCGTCSCVCFLHGSYPNDTPCNPKGRNPSATRKQRALNK